MNAYNFYPVSQKVLKKQILTPLISSHCLTLKRSFFLSLAIFLLYFIPVPIALASSPLDTITIVQKGVDTSDIDTAEQGIDLDSVLSTSIDTILEELKKVASQNPEPQGKEKKMSAFLSSLDGQNSVQNVAIKALILQEAKTFTRAIVRGGYLAGKPDPSAAGKMGLFSSLSKRLGSSRKQITPGKILSQEEDEAMISASYIDKNRGTFPLQLKVKKEQGNWRIKEVANLRELIEKALNEK